MIQRDGNNISLWQASANDHQSLHFASPADHFDVIIVGGGITGISAALLLQETGKRCLVFEAANLGFGTTGGTTAHLNTLLDTPYTTIAGNFSKEDAKLVATAAGNAIDMIRSNVKKYGIDCEFEETAALMFSQDEKEDKELDKLTEATIEAGVAVEYVTSIECEIPFIRAIRVPGQAKFNPILYVQGMAKAFEQAGGIIMQHCRVDGVKDVEPVEVKTEKGEFTCTDLIYATHIPPGVNLLHLRCAPWRSYAMAVRLVDQVYPESLIYDMKDPYHYYRSQVIDGETYFIAGGYDHKTGEEEDTNHSLTLLEAHVRKHFNVREVTNRWSSQYFEPADGLPYIGQLPGHSRHILTGTGYGGNGMIYSSVAAMVFSEIIRGEETAYAKLFSPSRIKPIAGFTNFISHNADVVKNFAGKILPVEKLEELVDLARGEAKVVKYNKEKVGIYKDDEGKVHAVNPTCTHMQCDVKWNSTEVSWDCPCHGARYSIEGKVLTGPSDRDLEKIQIEQLISK